MERSDRRENSTERKSKNKDAERLVNHPSLQTQKVHFTQAWKTSQGCIFQPVPTVINHEPPAL